MAKGRRWVQTVLNAADFPAEILTGVPVVEIHGDSEAVVLNHRGVLCYDETQSAVASCLGPVRIRGGGLEIHRMDRGRIVIHGRVDRVELGRGAGC